MATSPAPVRSQPELTHIPALDGLRGIAILMVLGLHLSILPAVPSNVLDRACGALAALGWCGVDLFFVLSGFLITRILVETREHPHYFRNFYARRTLRIFPLYYLCLLLYFNLSPYLPGAAQPDPAHPEITVLPWFLFYASNLYLPWQRLSVFPAELAVSWSLAVEEQFYLLWPAVVRWVSPRHLLQVCVGVALLAVGIRVWIPHAGLPARAAYMFMPARADSLAIGAIVAVLATRPGGLLRVLPWARACGALAGLGAAAVFGHGLWLDWRMQRAPDIVDLPLTQGAGYLLAALFFGCVVAQVLGAGTPTRATRALEWAPLRTLGKYSYAMYLFHLPVRRLLADGVLAGRTPPLLAGSLLPAQLAFSAVGTLLTLGLAWLSWHFYESRFNSLKRHFPYR